MWVFHFSFRWLCQLPQDIEQLLLSVYPKHYSSDQPGWGLEGMDLENIIKEIEKTGFVLKKKIFGRLLHDDTYNEGYVLNCLKL